MLKSNKAMYCLLLLAILVLVIGNANFSSAATVDEGNLTDEICCDAVYDEADVMDEAVKEPLNIKKHVNKNIKTDAELQPISIYAEDVECDYGETVDLNVVTDPEVDEGYLTWFIDDQIVGSSNLSNTPASYNLIATDFVPGDHEILVTYTGSTMYRNAQTTALFTVNKIACEISNLAFSFDDDNNIDVKLNVLDNTGESLDFGTLNVYQDSVLIKTVEIEDYDVAFKLDKKYNMELLEFEFVGDRFYDNAVADEFVYVEKFNCNIYLPYLNVYQSSIVNESLTFYTDRRVNDGVVNVYVDGVLTSSMNVEDSSVNVVIDTGKYLAGTHTLYIEYVGSDVFDDANYQTNLNVKQVATTLYTYNITAHKNDIVNFRAIVYNYVDECSEGMLEFFLDDESIKTVILNSSSVNESYYVSDNIDYGVHEVKVVYYGTQKYLPSQSSAVLNVTRYPNTVSIKNYTLDNEGNIVINIRAYSYNMDVDDGQLEVIVDGNHVCVENVSGNITCITLPAEYEADNDYIVDVRYVNSEKFEDASISQTITPEKYETSTRIYDFVNNQNILNLTSYVYSEKYDEINEGVIELFLNDTMIGRLNVTNNRVNLLYDLDNFEEKNYTLTAHYNGTRTYRQSTNTTTINFQITRKTVYITASQIKTTPGNMITIDAKLNDYYTNTINLTTPAKIQVLNETIDAQFNEGILSCDYHVKSNTPEDTYNITITVDQTKYYKNVTRNIKLIVAKHSTYITSTNNINYIKGETLLVNATLNLDNEVLNEKIQAIVKINNKTVYQGFFVNGQLQYKLKLNDKYTSNSYNITIKSKETTHYHTAEKTITLNLKSRNTYIVSKNIISKNNEQIIINATIYDSITRKIVKTNAKACIKINEVTLENLNLRNGRLVYSYVNDYSAKNYSIHIIYGENGMYNKSEWYGNIEILSTPVQIVTGSINAKAGSTINIKAQVQADNTNIDSLIKTAIKIDNKTIMETNITDGVIDVNYTLSEDLSEGTHNLTIITGDSRKYTSNTTTVDLIVTKNYKHINASDITAPVGSVITIKADILDVADKLVNTTTPVTIKVGGRIIAEFNVTNGKIEYDYTLPSDMKKGVYEIVIQAKATKTYRHATENYLLKVV